MQIISSVLFWQQHHSLSHRTKPRLYIILAKVDDVYTDSNISWPQLSHPAALINVSSPMSDIQRTRRSKTSSLLSAYTPLFSSLFYPSFCYTAPCYYFFYHKLKTPNYLISTFLLLLGSICVFATLTNWNFSVFNVFHVKMKHQRHQGRISMSFILVSFFLQFSNQNQQS